MKRSAYALVRDEAQEWRLPQCHRQALVERFVKVGIARLIGEIRDNNCVFVCEFGRAAGV